MNEPPKMFLWCAIFERTERLSRVGSKLKTLGGHEVGGVSRRYRSLDYEDMPSANEGFRKDIEGLRAVAVLLVLAYHASLFSCKGGFIGVDVFFVLSGYLISGILVSEACRSGTIDLANFYARRIRRLVPASILMLVFVIFAGYELFSPFQQPIIAKSVFATATYLSNIYFAKIGGGYFAPDMSKNPLLHTWSLAAEEQFYLVWPLLILLIYRWKRSHKILCITLAFIGVVSLVACVWLTRVDQPMAFFLMPPRVWEFALGGLAGQVQLRPDRYQGLLVRCLGWAGLTAIVAAGFTISSSDFPGAKVILPVLGTALVLVAGRTRARMGVSSFLSTRAMQYIGKRSYGVYLWHWPMLVFGAVLFNSMSLGHRLVCVFASFVVADLTYRTIENPIRVNPYLRSHPWACIGGSLAVLLTFAAGGTAWKRWSMQTANYKTYARALTDIPDDWAMGCEVGYKRSDPRRCDFGSSNPLKMVVLFGDSHMEQWLPAFQEIAEQRHWKIVMFTKSACPALAIPTMSALSSADHSCDDWRRLSIERIRQLHSDAVLLSNATNYVLPEGRESALHWRVGARQTFTELAEGAVPVIFIRDTPSAPYDVTDCLSRASWHGVHPCPSLVRSQALSDSIYREQVEGSLGVRDVHFVDMSDQICGPVYCDLTRGDYFIYRGNSHLTGSFLRSISADLYEELLRAAPSLNVKP